VSWTPADTLSGRIREASKKPAPITKGASIESRYQGRPGDDAMQIPEHQDNSHRVKRVSLPSGKTIEVVYFQEGARHAPRELHLCPDCNSNLVYPIDWSEASQTHWEVMLRCPNCEWFETGVFDQDTVEQFDEELDRGTDDLVEDLKRLIYANMEEQIDRFCEALANDHVLPEDF
jgi:hypothetical protein